MIQADKKIEATQQWVDNRDMLYRYCFFSLLVALFLFIPQPAMAACADPLCSTLCVVINWFAGPSGEGGGLGRPIATLGVVVLGIGAMMGKVSWQMALITAVGMAIMVSGAKIVSILVATPGVDAATLCEGIGGPEPIAIADALCSVAKFANTATGRALGTISIIILGVSALMGKVSAGVAITLAVGIATIFGAGELASVVMNGTSGGATWACPP